MKTPKDTSYRFAWILKGTDEYAAMRNQLYKIMNEYEQSKLLYNAHISTTLMIRKTMNSRVWNSAIYKSITNMQNNN